MISRASSSNGKYTPVDVCIDPTNPTVQGGLSSSTWRGQLRPNLRLANLNSVEAPLPTPPVASQPGPVDPHRVRDDHEHDRYTRSGNQGRTAGQCVYDPMRQWTPWQRNPSNRCFSSVGAREKARSTPPCSRPRLRRLLHTGRPRFTRGSLTCLISTPTSNNPDHHLPSQTFAQQSAHPRHCCSAHRSTPGPCQAP